MTSTYKKLILDPRCLKPSYETKDPTIYKEALTAIDSALSSKYITFSEKNVLESAKTEIRKNRYLIK